jgi:CheY-like chemotaxis protein
MPHSPLIAIVDDDVRVGNSMVRLLSAIGFRTHFYDNATDFLFSLGMRKPDCVLIDANMPEVSGLMVMDCIRSMDSHLPMLLITGSVDEYLWQTAEYKGACGVLLKPYCVDDLCSKINQALGCPGYVPNRCPWPCPLLGKAVWKCAFSGIQQPPMLQALPSRNSDLTAPRPDLAPAAATQSKFLLQET